MVTIQVENLHSLQLPYFSRQALQLIVLNLQFGQILPMFDVTVNLLDAVPRNVQLFDLFPVLTLFRNLFNPIGV